MLRGLGAVIAHKFAAAGSNIAINYANNGKAARDLADSLEKDYGVNAVVVKAVCILQTQHGAVFVHPA